MGPLSEPPRLAVVVSHPIQYQAPLWRALAADGRVEPFVVFLSRHGVEDRVDPNFGTSFAWDVDLLSGYRSRLLFNLREKAPPGGALSYVNPGIARALEDIDPSAVLLLGVRNPTSVAALAWARARGVRALYRAESSVLQTRRLASLAAAGAILRRFDAVLSIGTANDLYYHVVGVSPDHRFLAPYSVDNAYFSARRMDRSVARVEVGIEDDEFVVLYVGKLVAWKDPGTLVDGCAGIAARVPLRLLVIGDGPERRMLEHHARARGVPLTVLGFVNQSELSVAYSASDVLVLASREEPWGLVVNEAMCHGLPVVVSSQVGARFDLVRHSVNGGIFRVGDASALERELRSLVESRERRKRYGAASQEIVRGWDIEQTVDGVVRAVLAE
jgi:glycosyltransferase involved in cell wall biosynthesis